MQVLQRLQQPVIGGSHHASSCVRVTVLPALRVQARRDASMSRRQALLREAPAPISSPLVRRQTETDYNKDSVDGLNKQQLLLAKVGAASSVFRGQQYATKQSARRWAGVHRMDPAGPATDSLPYI
jgi:hypothetical protein